MKNIVSNSVTLAYPTPYVNAWSYIQLEVDVGFWEKREIVKCRRRQGQSKDHKGQQPQK